MKILRATLLPLQPFLSGRFAWRGRDALKSSSGNRSGKQPRQHGFAVVLAVVALLLLRSSLAAQTYPAPSDRELSDDTTQEALRFTRIYGALEHNYADAFSPDQIIMNGAIRGMPKP